MKKIIVITGLLLFSISQLWAQNNSRVSIPMIGEEAPSFTAEATTGTVNFPADYPLQWKILFSHPADFTPVCTSEILELAASQAEFNKLRTKIVVISVDSLDTHFQWEKDMETIKYKNREPAKINFPLVADVNLGISKMYGMIHPNSNSTRDVRGVFIVDPKDKIRAIFFYPMNIGRNLGEIERTLIALQTADKNQVLTPANWQPGGDVLVPYIKTKSQSEKMTAENDPDYYQVTWYMRFKKGVK